MRLPRLRDILESWCAAGVSGALRVLDPPGGTVYLLDGGVEFAECSVAAGIERLLTASGRLPAEVWRTAVNAGRAQNRVGEQLLETGLLTTAELESVVLLSLYDAAHFLFDLDATTRFEPGARHHLGYGRPLDLKLVNQEVDRRKLLLADAWPDAAIDTAAVVPQRRLRDQCVALTALQWEVVANSDRRRTPVDLARLLGRDTFTVMLEVRRMVRSGLVEPGRPGGSAAAGSVAMVRANTNRADTDRARPESAYTESDRAEGGRVDRNGAESGRVDRSRAENGRAERSSGEGSGGEGSGGEGSGAESGRVDRSRAEDSRAERNGGERNGGERNGGERNGGEGGRVDRNGAEGSGGEGGRADHRRGDHRRGDHRRAEGGRAETIRAGAEAAREKRVVGPEAARFKRQKREREHHDEPEPAPAAGAAVEESPAHDTDPALAAIPLPRRPLSTVDHPRPPAGRDPAVSDDILTRLIAGLGSW
jgi:hypothetical protein